MDEIESQVVSLTEEDLKIFKDVDSVIGRAVTVGDPLLAFEFGSSLLGGVKVRGFALAKLLYRLREAWGLFRAGGIDDEMITMVDVHMGVRPETTKKYIRMWEKVFENDDVPEDTKRLLMGRNLGDVLLLTAAVGDGSLNEDELKDAALASDRVAIRDIIRQKRGQKTSSSSSIVICLRMSDGALYAKRGDDRETIGILNKPESEIGEKAIARLIGAAGIVEVYNGGS